MPCLFISNKKPDKFRHNSIKIDVEKRVHMFANGLVLV